MTNEIKDCPFCGSTADVQSDFGVDFWVQCANLHCGSTDGTIYKSPKPAIEHWNRRPESLAAPSVASASMKPFTPQRGNPVIDLSTCTHVMTLGNDVYVRWDEAEQVLANVIAALPIASAAKGDELPPLPESDWVLAGSANNREAYTANQMISYARAAVLAERAACAKLCDEQANEPECPERAAYCADAIRARN